MYVCVYVNGKFIFVYLCASVYICVQVYFRRLLVPYMYVDVHTYVCKCVSVFTYMCVYMCASVYICVQCM